MRPLSGKQHGWVWSLFDVANHNNFANFIKLNKWTRDLRFFQVEIGWKGFLSDVVYVIKEQLTKSNLNEYDVREAVRVPI